MDDRLLLFIVLFLLNMCAYLSDHKNWVNGFAAYLAALCIIARVLK